MARKTSDIALLLGSRGRSRSRKGGFAQKLFGYVEGLFGRKTARSLREDRAQKVSVWLFAVGLLVAFGSGFLIGGGVGGAGVDENPLNANGNANGGDRTRPNGGQRPAFVGEVDATQLSSRAYVVSAYANLDEDAAREQADGLARWLQGAGLQKARAYLFPRNGQDPVWTTAVYFDGDAEAVATRNLLLALPADVPDRMFVAFRKKGGESWPAEYTIR